VTVDDETLPVVFCAFEPVAGDEDEDNDEDEDADGVYTIRFGAGDNCDADAYTEAFLDAYGTDESCDEDPDFVGYPVEDGDIVLFHCDDKVECARYPGSDTDEDSDIDVEINAPGMRLLVTAVDDCDNLAEVECLLVCP
jgi:hypothetical protein